MATDQLPNPDTEHKSVTVIHPDAPDPARTSAFDPCTYAIHETTTVADIIEKFQNDWKDASDIVLEYDGKRMYGDEKLKDISDKASIVFQTARWSLATIQSLKHGGSSNDTNQSITNAVRVVKEAVAVMQIQDFNSKAQFLNLAESVSNMSARSSPVIAIVGPTGAGKSTMIEALLGIRGVIPSNCYRACTAVPTFISYNEREELPFKVTFHYVTRKAFKKTIEQSVRDVLDHVHDSSSEAVNNDVVKAAWSRLHVMFPHLQKGDLQDFDPIDALTQYSGLDYLLGSSAEFQSDTIDDFIAQTSCHFEPEYTYPFEDESYIGHAWPLIEKIELMVRSEVLETGVTLIDLPGVGDTNSDRANVWRQCIRDCSAIWIVTPIARAGHAQEAHKLLSESFRRQLQLDGTVLSVGFICTGTDVLDPSPSWKQLNLNREYGDYKTFVQELDEPRIQKERVLNDLVDKRKKIETAEKRAHRKHHTLSKKTSKKRKAAVMDDEERDATISGNPELVMVERELEEYQRQEDELNMQIDDLVADLQELDRQHGTGAEEAFLLCMRTRNAKQKAQLKLGFRETLKALHREDNLDQIVERVPIFTVSATEFQRISYGETGGRVLPRSSRHYVQGLADADVQQSEHFFDAVIPWALRMANISELTEEQKEAELLRVRADIHQCIDTMVEKTAEVVGKARRCNQSLTDRFVTQAKSAVGKIPALVNSWRQGLYYSTYAAIVRRGGIFAGSCGAYNWIEAVVTLMWHEGTDQQWYNAWNTDNGEIHQIINSLNLHFTEYFKTFEDKYNKSAESKGTTLAYHRRLRNILDRHRDNMTNKIQKCEERLQRKQKDANRVFSETVPGELEEIFEAAVENKIKGNGAYKRLQNYLAGAFDGKKARIYKPGIASARKILTDAFRHMENDLMKAIEKLRTDIDSDMTGLFSEESESVMAKELQVRDQVLQKLRREHCILDEKALLRDIEAAAEFQLKDEIQVFPVVKEEAMSDFDDGYGRIKNSDGDGDNEDDDDSAHDAYLQASQRFAAPAYEDERASPEQEYDDY